MQQPRALEAENGRLKWMCADPNPGRELLQVTWRKSSESGSAPARGGAVTGARPASERLVGPVVGHVRHDATAGCATGGIVMR